MALLVWSGQWTKKMDTAGGSASSKDTSMAVPLLEKPLAVVAFLQRSTRDSASTRTQGRRTSERREVVAGESGIAEGRGEADGCMGRSDRHLEGANDGRDWSPGRRPLPD
jgi:hypothetical protein